MGSNRYTHIGPFVRVLPKIVEYLQDKVMCAENNCGREPYGGARFCSVHGKEFVAKKVVKRGNVLDDVLDKHCEAFATFGDQIETDSKDPGTYLIPNFDYGGPGSNHCFGNEGPQDVSQRFISEDMSAFLTFYKTQIEDLQLVMGDDKVSVHWGVLNYWS